jgi:RNA processing factor Prp31
MKAIDRLYEYFEYKGIKPTNLEREIQLSNGYFSIQRKRKADIGETALKKITDYCRDLNPTWLLTSNGEMLLDFTKGITGGENPDTDKEFNEINNELGVLETLLHANKRAKEVSDKFDNIRGKLIVIETYTKQYELLNRMISVLTGYSQKQVKMNDVKEEFKANIETIFEIVSILEPYSEAINGLFEKLSEFDNRHDKIFLIEE